MFIKLTEDQFRNLKIKSTKPKPSLGIKRIRRNKSGEVKELVRPEKAILNSILEYLWSNGYYVWRQNSGAIRTQNNTFIRLAPSGTADIIGMTPTGRFLAIETKTAKGKQRFSQEVFERRVKENGGIYILSRSVNDVIQALQGIDN